MKWQGREQSSNIEDRRGQGGGFGGGGLGGGFGGGLGGGGLNPFGNGGGIPIPTGRGGGIGSIVIIIVFVLIAMAFGVNPMSILTGDSSSTTSSLPTQNASQDELRQFVGVIVKDTEDYWTTYFQQHGASYTPPKVVLFTGQTQSGCGTADRSSGPFYCPEDQKVYLDLGFYQELRDQFGAPGDFAQAYVIAHEVGHHVQDVLGILPKFNQARQSMSQEQANAYSVKIELQADCFAGMWGKGEQQYLDDGDVQEAITAANQIGDDTLTHGSISPRQYTHGTSAQRQQWLKTGLQATDISQCNTGLPN